jgi:hypothetical protein
MSTVTLMDRYPELREEIAKSGVTKPQIDAMEQAVFAAYDELAEPLPDTMWWKTQKPAHARRCRAQALEFASVLGLTDLEVALFALLFASHDLGRLVEAGRTSRGEPRAKWLHGKDSVDIMRPILGQLAETTLGHWIMDALEHHSDAQDVTLETVGGSRGSFAMCTTLRDLDKVEGFRSAVDYTSNLTRKAKERLQNWPEQVKQDPAWGTELGQIDPDRMLDLFEQGQPIPRAQCRSFEAYMLQYLRWTRDVVNPEMLAIALREGGPQIVAAYLLTQLKQGAPEQYARLLQYLLDWKDGALLA